jgi:hypothetical protein
MGLDAVILSLDSRVNKHFDRFLWNAATDSLDPAHAIRPGRSRHKPSDGAMAQGKAGV